MKLLILVIIGIISHQAFGGGYGDCEGYFCSGDLICHRYYKKLYCCPKDTMLCFKSLFCCDKYTKDIERLSERAKKDKSDVKKEANERDNN